MRATILTTALLVGLLGVCGAASAQTSYGVGCNDGGGSPWYYGGYHASTYEEGVLRGSAAVIESVGQYNLATSQAEINMQEVRSKAFDNDLKKVETYFAMRRLNREQVAEEMGPRATSQELAAFAKEGVPQRLNGSQYEPALGRVFWPAVLQDEAFAASRKSVDTAMAMREPGNSGLGSMNFRELKLAVSRMQEVLKANVDAIPPVEYVQAKKFLASLEWEAQHRMAPTGLALVR